MRPRDAATAVALDGVSFVRDGRRILDDVSWEVRRGERWVVLGPNGAGKSTLLRIASTYELPTRGRAIVLGNRVGGTDLRRVRRSIGLLAPALARALAPGTSAREAVVTGADATLRRWRQEYTPGEWRRVDELLDLVGCSALADVRFDRLSEGERQRVLMARALLPRPALLLLDEPGANVDVAGRERLVHALSRITADADVGATVLVTHHVEEIPPGCTHALLLRRGRAVTQGPLREVLTDATMSACFGLSLHIEEQEGRFIARAGAPARAGLTTDDRGRT